MSQFPIIAVDDGFAETKVFGIIGNERIQFSIHSAARTGAQGAVESMSKALVHPTYSTEGMIYTVGANLQNAESARFDDYPFSGMNRAIVHHALRLAAKQVPALLETPITVATGLPLFSYYAGGRPNHEFIGRKVHSLIQPIQATDGSPVTQIASHQVFPEGLAAWVDYAMDDDLAMRDGIDEQTIGVIDVGGRTTDIAVILPGQMIDHAHTNSVEVGVQDVLNILADRLNSRFSTQFGMRVALTPHQLQEAITGSVKLFGKPQDVQQELQEAVREVVDRLQREVTKRLGNAAMLDKVLLVGGGAALFAQLSDLLPNIEIPEDPSFANARGFAKYAMARSGA